MFFPWKQKASCRAEFNPNHKIGAGSQNKCHSLQDRTPGGSTHVEPFKIKTANASSLEQVATRIFKVCINQEMSYE